MNLQTIPLFAELESAKTILLAGAGGGYDIFCGLPLYFCLKSLGKTVHLANLSFSYLPQDEERWSPTLLKVTPDTPNAGSYFPEYHLTNWFQQQGWDVPIYSFNRSGFKPLHDSYTILLEKLSIDTVILVDGGTDSLMRGDEYELGTPAEDMTSIAVVDELDIPRKMMVCLGFGIDSYHGVCHAHFLENVSRLIQSGGYLGTLSLLEEMPEVQQYRAACEYVFQQMPKQISIVSSSILSALAGYYGDHHATPRTSNSELWINPLMSLYWCFQLSQVANQVLYLDELKQTETSSDVAQVLANWRENRPNTRSRKQIPV